MTDKELLEKYPWLRLKSDIEGTKLDLMPDGWRIAFGEQMCEEIQKLLEEADYVNEYRIIDIKEKWGELRWYDRGVPQNYYAKLQSIIHKYGELSLKTCIDCGKPAKYFSLGWISPYCEECAEENGCEMIPIEQYLRT